MSIFFRVLLSILLTVPSLNLFSQNQANSGLLDARSVDFTSSRLSLNGEWLWIDGKLVSPNDFPNQPSEPVEFPKIWNDVRSGGLGQGVATYSLTILLPTTKMEYAIDIPQMYSSYTLWINGVFVAGNGTPGENESTTKSQWLPQTVSIVASDTLSLVLQIANFDHNKGGCKEPIYLGEQKALLSKASTSKITKIVECSMLLLIASIFLLVFWRGKRKKVIVYFALLCATWSVRSAFSNEYLAIKLMPEFDWVATIRIEYITLYLTMVWSILFLSRLFVNESNQIVKYILVILNVVYVIFTSLNPPLLFTKLLALYLVTSGILLTNGIIIIIRAYINERTGASFLSISVLLAIATFSSDIFAYEGMFSYRSVLFSTAYVAIFVMVGLALLLHLGVIKSSNPTSNRLTYEDLYGKR